MTFEQALQTVAQQSNMLVRIREEQDSAMRPINDRIFDKIRNHQPLDATEHVYAQINGLI